MNIGIDCDGVLRNFTEGVITIGKKHGLVLEKPTTWNWLDLNKYNGRPLAYYIWQSREWAKELFENSPIIPGSFLAYKELVDLDYTNVYIVTTQSEKTKHHTIEWLNKFGFDKHVKTIFSKEKHKTGMDILIDDKYDNIKKQIDTGRLGHLIKQPYNEKYEYPFKFNHLEDSVNWIKNEVENNDFLNKIK